MESYQIIIFLVVSGGLSLCLILNLIFKSVRGNLEKHIQEKFETKDIIGATTRANFFGIKSKGVKQVRGNGAMVLTKDRLWFIRAVPLKEYEIPVNSIKRVSLPRSFNGKSVFAKLLCIHYEHNGVEDSIAWAIKNPLRWKESIEELIARTHIDCH